MKIIAATSNAGKLREIKSIFSDKDINIISQKEAGIKNDAEETGETFEENAAYLKEWLRLRHQDLTGRGL